MPNKTLIKTNNMIPKITKILIFALLFSCQSASERSYIRMAGSSTVYPFARAIANEFGNSTDFRTPIVEATGTGGGFKLFCSGVGYEFIDFANASRRIEQNEIDNCKKNGVNGIVEIKIGYDGIVLANSKFGKQLNFTKQQIFSALAKEVVIDGKLVLNPYKKWSDIDKSLPNKEIAVYGPPTTSGTRDAFVELVMEEPCVNNPVFAAKYSDKKVLAKACHVLRSDGKYIEAGENDNLIIQKLRNNPDAIGIFGYSFLEQNNNIIQGSKISGVTPTFESIVANKYKISRPLFIYLKKEHLTLIKGMKEFVEEIVSERTIGDKGFLIEKGLIPVRAEEIAKMKKEILGGL